MTREHRQGYQVTDRRDWINLACMFLRRVSWFFGLGVIWLPGLGFTRYDGAAGPLIRLLSPELRHMIKDSRNSLPLLNCLMRFR